MIVIRLSSAITAGLIALSASFTAVNAQNGPNVQTVLYYDPTSPSYPGFSEIPTSPVYVGDHIVFPNGGDHRVVTTDNADLYQRCTAGTGKPLFDTSVSGSFIPSKSGTYYFICLTNDHCSRANMKFILNVQDLPTTSQPPQSSAQDTQTPTDSGSQVNTQTSVTSVSPTTAAPRTAGTTTIFTTVSTVVQQNGSTVLTSMSKPGSSDATTIRSSLNLAAGACVGAVAIGGMFML
ncbi:hypothetical protein HDU76_008585 [Blyttiomyces sp. JEL0837]|nr:hypothetical protein HDU76_008585 [Blyttiomyces sp. JEL0837]